MLLTFILIVGVFGTVTNFIYLSAVPSVLFLVMSPLLLIGFVALNKLKINKITFYTLLFYIISICSILLYDPGALLSFEFYRRDGNFIISYAPFLILPFLYVRKNINRTIGIFLLFTVFINLFPIFIYLINFNGATTYGGLFIARNAAGGFLAVVAAFAIARFLEVKSIKNILILLFLLSCLMLTYSRGSILGLFAGYFSFFLYKRFNTIKLTLLVIFIVIFIQAAFIYEYYPVYKHGVGSVGYAGSLNVELTTKLNNVLTRLLEIWPRAVEGFLESPLIGTGFGSFNDMPYNFNEIIPGVAYISPEVYAYDSGHAHHSYLHVLAEQGVIGLLVLLLMWYNIHYFLIKHSGQSWIRDGLLIAFWTLIFASFTEHRLTTPSNILPFALVFSLFYGWQKGRCKI